MRFTDYFAYQVRTRPDAPCISDETRSLTYAEADRAANIYVNAVRALPAQTRVALVADNSVDFLLLDLATTKANLILVPINTRLIPDEWAQIIEHSEAVVVFASAAYRGGLESISARVDGVRHWVALDEPDTTATWTGLEEFLAEASDDAPDGAVEESDIDLQLYTSGTTGLPKGVLHSHRSMTISVSQWAQMVEPWDGLRGRCLIAAPLFHGAPLIMWRTVVCWGGHVQTQRRFDPDAVLDAAVEAPICWTFLVPSMIHACLDRARTRPAAEYQINLVMYGGSPIAEVVLREAMRRLGRHFLQIYGMTESLLTTTLTPADHERALNGQPRLLLSAGRPIAGVSVAIDTGESEQPAAANIPGEVVVRCPNPMVGYSKNPHATSEIIRDGRMYSGDAGYVDDEGYLYIHDRVKDMIVTGGENVFSTEVEGVLHEHPSVADAAVIGTPDPRWGEIVTAVLVAEDGHEVSGEDIVAFCRQRIAHYKVPKRVDVVAALPRNSTGKLLKSKLRQQYWEGHARTI